MVYYSATIDVYGIKVGIFNKLNECMEIYMYQIGELLMSSRGHFLLIMIVIYQNICLDV